MNQFMLDFVWPLVLVTFFLWLSWMRRDKIRVVDVHPVGRALSLAASIGVNAFVVFLWIMSPADGQRSFVLQLASIPGFYVGITGKWFERRKNPD